MSRTLTFLCATLALLSLRCGAGEIHDAVLKRDLATVERILKANPRKVNTHTFPDYKTPLHLAVDIGEPAIAKRLLAVGADANAEDAGKMTPLLRASWIAGEDTFQVLAALAESLMKKSTQAFEDLRPGSAFDVAMKSIAALPPGETRSRLETLAAILARKPELKACGDGSTPLHFAAMCGNAGAVKALLAAGADPNVRNLQWLTPLHMAALSGAGRETIDALVAARARMEAGDRLGCTPLMGAAWGGFHETVEALLSHGARVDAEDNAGFSAICDAAMNGHDEIVKLLHAKGGRALIRDARPDALFHAAAKGGSMALAEILLAGGVDVNTRDPEGYTPLLTTVDRSQAKLSQFLIEKGADRTAVTKSGCDLFYIACMSGNTTLVKELIAAGADVNRRYAVDDQPILYTAILQGRADVVELLIARGADASDGAFKGGTPLLAAVTGRNAQLEAGLKGVPIAPPGSEDDYARIVEMLLARGAKTDAKLQDGTSLMHFAARYCNARVMKALLKAGANPSERDSEQNTLLHSVAAFGRGETAAVLIEAGTDVRAVNKNGSAPLHAATTNRSADVMKILLAHRAPVNVATSDRKATPLHSAAYNNFPDAVRLLLEAGANPDARDAVNATPLIPAAMSKQTIEIIKRSTVESNAWLVARAQNLKSRLKVIQLLLEAGATTDAPIHDPSANTPLSLIEAARRYGTPEIVELLENPPALIKKPRKP